MPPTAWRRAAKALTRNSRRLRSCGTFRRVKTFPLAALATLRAHEVEGARDALQEKEVLLQRAQRAHAEAERLEREHDARRHDVEHREATRLLAGEGTIRDLAQLCDYDAQARATALRLRQQNQVQAQKVQRALQERSDAERALAETRAQQRVIERQLERHQHAERLANEAAAEEEALEVWLAQKVRC